MVDLLHPTSDVVFKMLFAYERNRRLLISLLTAVLEPSVPIVEVDVLNPEIDKESIRSKGIALDVRAVLQDGRRINVEMQARWHPAWRPRTLLYWARLYADQLERGGAYADLAPTVGVLIQDFVDLPSSHFHSEFQLLESREHYAYSDHLILHVLELPKVPAALPAQGQESEPLLARWGRFLRAKNEQNLEELAMTDPIFREAKGALEDLSADPKARRLAQERRDALYFYEVGLRHEREQAAAEGHEQGRLEGQRSLLQQVLVLKFGALPEPVLSRLREASEAELTLWADRLLSAASLDEILT